MEQLKLYITLLRYNCVTIAHQALGELYNSNCVLSHDRNNSTIYMDGNWWLDFIMSHNFYACETIILHILHTKHKAKHLHFVFGDLPSACFTWNDDVKMYLANDGGCHEDE